MKETDLFEPVKKWLEDGGYEVYSEVLMNRSDYRADIVALCKPVVTVVEMKTSLTLELLGQAVRWKGFANYIYIAIPKRRRYHIPRYVETLLLREGIGLLEVAERYGEVVCKPHYHVQPKFHRRISNRLRDSITEYHKDFSPPGGHQGGGYITPYRVTMIRVQEYLKRRYLNDGWATVKEILENVSTHYSSPKSSLAKALVTLEQDWCETKKENGKLYFRYKKGE